MRGEIPFPIYYPESVKKRTMDVIFRSAYLRFYLSGRTIRNYLPLFKDINFFIKSLTVFLRLTFGKTVYK